VITGLAAPRRFLMCGNVYSWGPNGIAVAPGVDPAGVLPGVTLAIDALRRCERGLARPRLVVIRELGEDPGVAAAGFRPMHGDPDMVLEISPSWRGPGDYLASLNSSYRRAARRVTAAVAEAGLTVEPLPDLAPAAAELHALYMQVWSHATRRGPPATPAYLPALARALPGFRCTVIRRAGRIVAFTTIIPDGDTAIGYLLGFDYSTNDELPIYRRLLQAVIEQAIDMRCRRISIGATALDAKARLGFAPVPRTVWVWHANPLLRAALPPLLALVPRESAPDRNPFRSGG
jgi:hypothetical protein